MPKNIAEMVAEIGEDTTVSDFKTVLSEITTQYEERLSAKETAISDLNEKVVKLMDAAVAAPAEEQSPDDRSNAFFKSAIHGNIPAVFKNKGRMVRNDDSWTEAKWDLGKNDVAEKAALGTVLRGDATTGSYLVPEAYESEVFRLSLQASVMMGRVRSIPMATRKIYWPAENATPSLTWVTDETTAKTETNPTFSQISLECETCAAWLTVTDELVEDSLVNLAEFFRMQFAEAWGAEFDKQVLNSNASPFTSILYNSSSTIRNMAAGKTDYTDIEYEDLLDLEEDVSAAAGEVALNGAIWIMHRKVFNALRRLKNDVGDPIYQKPADGVPATLYGYPYVISEQMPSTTAADAPFLILGNPKYWLHGNRVGMQFQTYNNTIRNVDYDQIFYKFRIRQAFVGAIPKAFGVLETAAS